MESARVVCAEGDQVEDGGGDEGEEGMDATATFRNASARARWIDADLRRINADEDETSEWRWTPRCVGANKRDRCFVRRTPDDPVWWIKVVGQVRRPSSSSSSSSGASTDEEEESTNNTLMANVDNLLDAALLPRQHEWHQLYRGGRIVERLDEVSEVCYFKYASPIFFISGRDTCYAKVRRDLPGGGFILSYRSIHHPVHPRPTLIKDCPPDKDYVRLAFEGAHMITPLRDEEGEGFTYTYIQHADAKGSLPKWMANRPQADVMLKEIDGVRKAACEGGIHHAT